ncbi:MAG: hypothetical protein JNL87_01385 [Burkholderiaceae bacterium]|nr:hypothetical protein [Burkholderiaceae bacterium]
MEMWAERIEQAPQSVLRRYFTTDAPLGPLNAEKVLSEHSVLLELLAERNLVNIQRRVDRPSIVIGRRGSGKTSYLKKLGLGTPHHLFLEIRTEKTFNLILGAINDIIRDAISVESVATVWDGIIWNCFFWLMHRTGRPHIGRPQIHQHLQSLGIDNCHSLDAVMSVFSQSMQRIAKETSGFAIDRIGDTLRGSQYENLKYAVSADLAKDGITALVLLDSLDEYPVRVNDFKKSLAGLLKCAGEFNAVVRNYELRLCLPSELYWEFRERISTNPQKDFSNQLVVRWQVGELLIAVCRRIMINLLLWHPKAYAAVRSNPLETRRDVDAFFATLFPPHVKNLNGRHERTDQYLLRHTQLLPRQMLLILAEIMRLNHANDGFDLGKAPFFSEDAIRIGIRDTEDTIVDEIFSAYRDRYGELPSEACTTILPSLPRVFTLDQFSRAVDMFCRDEGRQMSMAKLKRMFLEIGAFGKVDQFDSMYRRGRFEYTMTSRLAVGADDKLCVHPLFSRKFECQPTDALDPPILPWTIGI